MKRKTLFGAFVFLFLFSSVFIVSAQTTLSGKYNAERDSIYSYFEFSDRNTVRIGSGIGEVMSEFMNPNALTVTTSYTIRNGYVIIEAQGMVIELKIINANTLEGISSYTKGVRFTKGSSSGQRAEGQKNYDDYINSGNTHYNNRNYDAAIADYTQAIRLNPNNTIAYNQRGTAYLQQGNYTAAIADLNEAIRLNPNNTIAYNNRSTAYLQQGNYTAAIADSNEAIRLNPKFTEAYSNRGSAYTQQGDYDRAIADLNEAIRLNPNFANAYRHRAFAHMNKGNFTQARADVNRALQINPNYENAQTLSAELRQRGY